MDKKDNVVQLFKNETSDNPVSILEEALEYAKSLSETENPLDTIIVFGQFKNGGLYSRSVKITNGDFYWLLGKWQNDIMNPER